MRRCFTVFLVLLLCFRAFAADAMATGMLKSLPGNLAGVDATTAQGKHPCHASQSQSSDESAEVATSECANCQVCHTPAIGIHLDLPALVRMSATAPVAFGWASRCAVTTPGLKPPIL